MVQQTTDPNARRDTTDAAKKGDPSVAAPLTTMATIVALLFILLCTLAYAYRYYFSPGASPVVGGGAAAHGTPAGQTAP